MNLVRTAHFQDKELYTKTISKSRNARTRAIILAAIPVVPLYLTIVASLWTALFCIKSLSKLKNPSLYVVIFIMLFATPALATDIKGDFTHSNAPVVVKQDSIQQQEISFIYQVFGKKNGDRAMQLLTRGNGYSTCMRGENHELNPKATNHNVDGSIDYGLFQINDYWNGFSKEVNNVRFLFDYKINTLIAYDIFKSNGYSFDRWTCGGGI